ncbi:MAG: flippase-like domain-containing protein [Chloroflexi bacterium]|nr:flippase-like domain-containing protein [Chloroflexota bacterium]
MNIRVSDRRQFIFRLIGTLLSIGLIILLVRQGGWADIVDALKKISFSNILLALVCIVASRFFVIGRWYVLLRSGGVKISFSDAAALTFTGLFSSNFLPTTIGGDVVRLVGAMQMGYDRAVCVASIAADRLVGMLGMFFALPFGLVPAFQSLHSPIGESIAFGALFNRLWDFIKRTVQTFSIWLKKPLAIFGALCCTWGHMLCTFIAFSILINGLGGYVPFWLVAGLWSLAYFVTLIPISINGYGVQELSLTFLFSSVAGLSTGVSLTVAVLIRALYLAVSLVGAIYLPGILAAMDTDRVVDDAGE